MTDILKVLYKLPSGTQLWSPICGACSFVEIVEGERYCIRVDADGHRFQFTAKGEGMRGGKCMLFPSEKQRDWTDYKPEREVEPTVKQFGEDVVLEAPKRTFAMGTPVFCSNELCPDEVLDWQLCVYQEGKKAQTRIYAKPTTFEFIVAFSDFDPMEPLSNIEKSI